MQNRDFYAIMISLEGILVRTTLMICVIFVLIGTACQLRTGEVRPKRMLVLGDSRATGYYLDDSGMIRHGYGWPEQLGIRLGATWNVENKAIDGANISLALEYLKDNPDARPDILVLQFGWNEMARVRYGRFPLMTPSEYRAALQFVRKWTQERGVELMVIDCTAPAYRDTHPGIPTVCKITGLPDGKAVIDALSELSRITEEELGPFVVHTDLTAECYQPDDFVHPNLLGHKRIERAVEARLLQRVSDGALAKRE